jgi:hypothetical protein
MVGAQKSWSLMFWEDEKIGYLKKIKKSIFQRTRRKFKMGSFLNILDQQKGNLKWVFL